MTKNNTYLSKENKAQIEEVREIDHQVLSFEEFVKTYENDSNVNYTDLESWDIGEVRGYGPCSSCGRSEHIFKLDFCMYNKQGYGRRKDVFYSPEEALSEATDILMGQNGWDDRGWWDKSNYGSGLRRKAVSAIKNAVRIYRLGGTINGWLRVKEESGDIITSSNYDCGTDWNGNSL